MPSIHVVIRALGAEQLTALASATLKATAAHRDIDLTVEVVAHGSLGDFMGREPARSATGFVYLSDPPVTGPMNQQVVVATRADAVKHAHALIERLVPRAAPPAPVVPMAVAPSAILAARNARAATISPGRSNVARPGLLAVVIGVGLLGLLGLVGGIAVGLLTGCAA